MFIALNRTPFGIGRVRYQCADDANGECVQYSDEVIELPFQWCIWSCGHSGGVDCRTRIRETYGRIIDQLRCGTERVLRNIDFADESKGTHDSEPQ